MKPQLSGTGYDILEDLPGDARIPSKRERAAERWPEPLRIGGPMPWHRPRKIFAPDQPPGRKKPAR